VEHQVPEEQRTWGMLAHLSALAGFIIPFEHIVGPLIVWLMKREGWPFVAENGKESLNFQISMTIYMVAATILSLLLIGLPFLLVLPLLDLVGIVIAAVRANKGQTFRYPASIKFLT